MKETSTKNIKKPLRNLSLIIPVYNESVDVVKETLSQCREVLNEHCTYEIIIVNDGSDQQYNVKNLNNDPSCIYAEHESNQGYGVALKTGILNAKYDLIGIIDADGTYPVKRLPDLLKLASNCDMVIGLRTGKIREIPLLRRFPKAVLNKFASYIAGTNIQDLNSGMRLFSKDLAFYLWNFFPTGFSFTSTITLGSYMNRFRVKTVSIDYFKRTGKSSIKPIKDTILFFRLVFRLGLIFSPMKIFGIYAFIFFSVGVFKGVFIDYMTQQYIGNLAVIFFISSIQIFLMGLLGQLIVHNRYIPLSKEITTKKLN